eukprot:2204061-Amphidinium_carterae.1
MQTIVLCARSCHVVDLEEIVWVKTNQLQRIIRTGRTGHWINHSKEHCLVGIKGNPKLNRNLDCDVIVSETHEMVLPHCLPVTASSLCSVSPETGSFPNVEPTLVCTEP